jgi:hypothetical protein
VPVLLVGFGASEKVGLFLKTAEVAAFLGLSAFAVFSARLDVFVRA